MQGEGKKGDFFPPTQLGTGSKGQEVSGFQYTVVINVFVNVTLICAKCVLQGRYDGAVEDRSGAD